LTLSGQGAGIAALGGAIGLPLWVVFGAGGAFLGVLIEEIRKSRRSSSEKTPGSNLKNGSAQSQGDAIDVEFVEVQPRKLRKHRKRPARPKNPK
jgi:hypothetical protein